jgi:hypothetical protein
MEAVRLDFCGVKLTRVLRMLVRGNMDRRGRDRLYLLMMLVCRFSWSICGSWLVVGKSSDGVEWIFYVNKLILFVSLYLSY